MKFFYTLFVVAIVNLGTCVSAQNVLPIPTDIVTGGAKFLIDETVAFSYTDEKLEPLIKESFYDFEGRMKSLLGIHVSLNDLAVSSNVVLRLLSDSVPTYMYRISISDSIFIDANSEEGFSNAFTTLLQAVAREKNKFYWPSMTVADNPFVDNRVLKINLTNGRPDLSIVKRQILLMQHLKLNMLVLVLANRDISLFPFKACAEKEDTYDRGELNELVKFAQKRHIRIIPQLSLPIAGWITDIDSTTMVSEADDSLRLPDVIKETTWTLVEQLLLDLKSSFTDSMVILSLGDSPLSVFYESSMAALVPNSDWQSFVSVKLSAIAKKHHKLYVLDETIFRPVDKENLIVRVTSPELLVTALQYGLRAYASNHIIIDENWKTNSVFNSDALMMASLKDAEGVEITMSNSWYKTDNLESRLWPAAADGAQLLWGNTPDISREAYSSLLVKCSVEMEAFGATHLTTPSVLLRRKTGSEGILPLTVLLSTLEPVGEVVELLGFADATVKTSYDVRSFNNAVREFLIAGKSEANFFHIRDMFQLWINNDLLLEATFTEHPEWSDLKKLSTSLAEIARLGDKALYDSVKGKALKPAAIAEAKRKLNNLSKPVTGMEFAIVDAVKGLIEFSEEHDEIVF